MFKVNGKQMIFFDEENLSGSNPNEGIDLTNPEIKDEYTPPSGSGLANMLAEYLPKEDPSESEDYVVEGLDESKAKMIQEELASKNPSMDNLKDFTEDELKIVTDKELFKASKSDEPAENTNPKLEDLDKEALINEIKKNQRFVSDRDKELLALKSIQIPKGTFSREDMEEFVKGGRTDIKATWMKFKDKFDLPDFDLVSRVNAQGSVEDRLATWQATTLKDKITKEFNLEKGEFEVVKEDLYTPKTPSYRWRKETETEERRLEGEVENYSKAQADTLKDNQDQQHTDVKWYADTYHGGNKEEVLELVNEINAIPTKINQGELEKDAHPFSLRNLLISANHEKLVKLEVDKAIESLTKQYNDKGFYIQAKETPFDVLKPSGVVPKIKSIINEEGSKFSPMLQSINQLINP